MKSLLHAVKEIPKALQTHNPHTFAKKIEQAHTNLRRLQRADEDSRRDGHILLKGDLYIQPHPSAKGPESEILPWSEAGRREEFLIHLGHASALLERHGDQKSVAKLRQEVERVKQLFLAH